MRTIDADALIQEMYRIVTETNNEAIHIDCLADEVVGNAPTVDAVPVVHGRWEPHYEWIDGDVVPSTKKRVCSACQDIWESSSKLKYCPNCGAKMDGDGNEKI